MNIMKISNVLHEKEFLHCSEYHVVSKQQWIKIWTNPRIKLFTMSSIKPADGTSTL